MTKSDGTERGTFASFTEALYAAKDGDTVKLPANHETDWDAVYAGEELMAAVKTKITLDLNGFTVDYLVVGEVVPDEEGGILESTEGDLTVVENSLAGGCISSLQLEKGKLTIEGGEIGTVADTGSFICSDENGEVNIKGGVVWFFGSEGGTANITGGKVYQLSVSGEGVVNISGGTNHGGWNDGTNYDTSTWSVNGGTLNITGGTFGKVLFNHTGGTVSISGGIFQSISASDVSKRTPVMPLLADGYAFYGKDTDNAYTVVQDSRETVLENVKVLAHTDHIFVDGKCIACGAMTCQEGGEGGCIAHAVWSPWAGDPIWGTIHIKTLDELRAKITDGSTWIDYKNTATVTFLSDVTVDKTFLIHQYYAQIVLDLNGHTLSGELQEPIITADFTAGNPIIAIQNGTIENTGTGEAIRLAKGRVTLENVNVTGDMAISYQYVNGSMYIAPFLGGGSFTKIRGVENDSKGTWSKKLKDMLGKGCYMVDSAGNRLDADKRLGTDANDSDFKELENVQCKACDHKDNNGEYALFVDTTTSYGALAKRCKVCDNLCPHDEVTTDGSNTCTVCGLPILIRTTNLAGNENTGPWYYTGLDDAMQEILHVNKGRRPTLELLADTESDCKVEWLTDDYEGIVIDPAGHTLTLTGNQNKASYWVTFQNTSDTPAKVVGTVNVYHKDKRSKLVILDTYNDLTIENVKFVDGGTAQFAGGSFGKITVPEGKPLASLLVSGCYFADSTTGKPAAMYDADGNALTELTNVTVKACSHDGSELVYDAADSVWKCPCGQVAFAASVTKDGTTTYYADLQEAFNAADGGTVKLMKNMVDVTVNTDKTFTLDLNGYTIHSLTVNSKITLKDSSEGTGKIAENLIVNVDDLTAGTYTYRLTAEKDGYEKSCDFTVTVTPISIAGAALEGKNPTYNGTEQSPVLTVKLGEKVLIENKDYTLSGTRSATDAGSYELTVVGKGSYTDKIENVKWRVEPKTVTNPTINVAPCVYNGFGQEPRVELKDGEKVIPEGEYTVAYSNNTDAGNGTVTIQDVAGGNYVVSGSTTSPSNRTALTSRGSGWRCRCSTNWQRLMRPICKRFWIISCWSSTKTAGTARSPIIMIRMGRLRSPTITTSAPQKSKTAN